MPNQAIEDGGIRYYEKNPNPPVYEVDYEVRLVTYGLGEFVRKPERKTIYTYTELDAYKLINRWNSFIGEAHVWKYILIDVKKIS